MKNQCPSCGAPYTLTPQHVGRAFTCQRCATPLIVQADGLRSTAPAAAPPTGSQPPAVTTTPAQPAARLNQEGGYSRYEDDHEDLAPYRHSEARKGSGSFFIDLLLFRRMIAPWVIMVLFWVGVLVSIIMGAIYSVVGVVMLTDANQRLGGVAMMIMGIGTVIIGPFVARLYAEFFIVVFRISETLLDILGELKRNRR